MERGSVSENDSTDPMKPSVPSATERVPSPGSTISSRSEHWMAETRERSGTVIDAMDYSVIPKLVNQRVSSVRNFDDTSSHHSSMIVEDSSEADLSDLNSMQDLLDLPDDDRSYLSDGDHYRSYMSDGDNCSDIGLGESAVDFEANVGMQNKDAERSGGGGALSTNDGSTSNESTHEQADQDCFTPNVLRIDEGLTDKVKDTLSSEKGILNEKIHPSEDVIEARNTSVDSAARRSKTDEIQQSATTSVETLARLAQDVISDVHPGVIIDTDVSSNHSSQISFADDHFDGELDRMIKSNAKRSLFERLDAHSGSADVGSISTGITNDSQIDVLDRGEFSNSPDCSHLITEYDNSSAINDSPSSVKLHKSSSFTEGRAIGHRRLQSAPVPLTPLPQHQQSISEDLLPSSPFEVVKPSFQSQHPNLSRGRSLSHGDHFEIMKGQESLKQIAEKICQVDRKDLEMDDPEEIQV